MPAKHFDLDTDILLGGEQSSNITIASQKATKTYIDTKIATAQPMLSAGDNIVISSDNVISVQGITTELASLTDTGIVSPENEQILRYNTDTSKWENQTLILPSKVTDLDNDANYMAATDTNFIDSEGTFNTVTAPEDDSTTKVATTEYVSRALSGYLKAAGGAISNVINSDVEPDRAIISNADGKLEASEVTSTEIGYLSGVTNNIQTQLSNKASRSHQHEVSSIKNMTGYVKGEDTSAIAETDTLSAAIGKLEKRLDGGGTNVLVGQLMGGGASIALKAWIANDSAVYYTTSDTPEYDDPIYNNIYVQVDTVGTYQAGEDKITTARSTETLTRASNKDTGTNLVISSELSKITRTFYYSWVSEENVVYYTTSETPVAEDLVYDNNFAQVDTVSEVGENTITLTTLTTVVTRTIEQDTYIISIVPEEDPSTDDNGTEESNGTD